jgi:hypothetical protein
MQVGFKPDNANRKRTSTKNGGTDVSRALTGPGLTRLVPDPFPDR